MPSSSWPIVMGLIALTLGAVWYDARNASAAAPTIDATPAQVSAK